MDPEEIKALLKSGIDAAKNNNLIIARSIFQQVIDADPRNELAWMWLAQVSDNTEHRRQALEEVLSINPNNEKARLALDKLQIGTGSLRPASTPPARPSEPSLRRSTSTPSEPVNVFRPVNRQQLPRDTWANSRRDSNRLGLWLTGGVAVALIGLAILLIVLRATGEDEAAKPTATFTPVIIFSPTATIPTATPTTGRIVPPITVTAGPNILPPTWTPSATWTPPPSPTWTPQPPELNRYRLVFSGNSAAGDPFVLYSITAANTELQQLTVSVPPFDDTGIAEPTEQPTEVPTDEVATEAPTEAPQLSNEIELLDPAMSPDGTRVVFTAQVGEVQELFVMDYPSGTPRQLTRLGAEQTFSAAWSPDGTSILFASNADGDFDVYLVDVASADDPINLTNNEEFEDRDPTWSPDGKVYAYASDRAAKGQLEIFVAPVQGEGDVCQMTESSNSSFSPVWSPDGITIAFITNRNTDNDLFIMRSDGSGERVLSVNDGDAEERDPAWSPDGRWLVVSSNRGDNPVTALWVVSPDGKTWQRVSPESEGEARGAQWMTNELAVGPAPDYEFKCAR
ncbi:MAG: PD40 domain-containing protein [Chloroflexi bacterium]|nr:PD40 domain-containing protein [Chloroflexota bacterium]